MNSLLARSRVCCEPLTISTWLASQGTPRARASAAMASRRAGSPSLMPYWPMEAGICSHCTFGSIGSAGSPPANDITSGRCAAARISRIKELFRREMRSEKAMGSPVA
ncbi:Uncharacterised protein [Acinetobacter baumannii]|nr:Uncharacterised protein [Acinetobacter baumannii]